MGSIKMVKTENFKFTVDSIVDGIATLYVSALLGTKDEPKDGELLFRFDRLSRTKAVTVPVAELWSKICSYETRLSQLLALKA